MALSGDQIMLAQIGVQLAEPFDWGDEPQMTIRDVNKPKPLHSNAQLSGIDSLRKFVVQDDDENDDNDNERTIFQSLFKEANVDLSRTVSKLFDQSPSHGGHKLIEDVTRDVPIKGLSDRAVAELTVESRTSLFGSILRLFDRPEDEGGNSVNDSFMKDVDGCKNDGFAHVMADVVHSTSVAAPAAAIDPMIMKDPILSTAEIVRSVHLTARMGDIPAGMDSKEYTMAVLHFLASYVPHLHEDESEYRNDFNRTSQEGWDQLRKTFPVLPLLKATKMGESLEMRCYGRVRPLIKLGQKERQKYPDSMDRDEAFRRKVLNLERAYSSSLPFSSPSVASPSSSNMTFTPLSPSKAAKNTKRSGDDLPFAFQRYVPRRKLLPHIEGGAKEELTLMISGHMQQPQHTPGPKPKAVKSKTAANPGPTAKATPTAKSAPPSGMTKSSNDEEKMGLNSILMPLKNKEDTSVVDGLLSLSRNGKEFST